MAATHRVVVLGGHGKVALRATRKFTDAGYSVDSVIRDPDQRGDVEDAGGNPVVLDIEHAGVDELTDAVSGATAVVFSAGAGGGNPPRTHAVDYEAAVRAMKACGQAGVDRFVLVSYASAAVDVDKVDPSSRFYPYAKAKHDADAHLRETELDYTILGPGRLTLDPGSGTIQVADFAGLINGVAPSDEQRMTSRENVAEVIVHVISVHAAVRATVNFYDGETPIEQALANVSG